jgi:hypothetical protein
MILTSISRTKRIFPQPPVQVVKRPVDGQKQAEQRTKARQTIDILLKVSQWVRLIEQDLNAALNVSFADYYRRISSEEPVYGFAIAVRVTHRLLKRAAIRNDWEVEITPQEPISTATNTPVTIWKSILMKK